MYAFYQRLDGVEIIARDGADPKGGAMFSTRRSECGRGRSRLALAAVVAGGALLGAAVPAEADTFQTYCNNNTPPKTRCAYHSSNDRWERNKADAPWTGFPWPMCERITTPGDYSDVWSRRCATAFNVIGWFDDYCGGCRDHHNPGYGVWMWVGNDHPDQPRTIRGIASYGNY